MLRIVFKNINWFNRTFKALSHIHIKSLDTIKNSKDLDVFFQVLIMPNRTSKQTTSERFKDVDFILLQILKSLADTKETLTIHDIGVSSGITSVNLYEKLYVNNFSFKLYVSDKYYKAYYAKKGLLEYVYNIDGALDYIYFSKILFSDKLSKNFFVSHFGFKVLKALRKNQPNHHTEEITLFHPTLKKLIQSGEIIHIEYDIMEKYDSLKEKFDVIRIMNVLNRNYFSEVEITKALNNAFYTLKNGGILVIGRTMPNGQNNVSFFIKNQKGLELIQDHCEGSEIKDYVFKVKFK